MDDIGKKVVMSAQTFLENLIAANALSPDQLTEAHMVVTALGYQLARDSYPPEILAEVRRSERELNADLNKILPQPLTSAVHRKWRDGWEASVGAELTKTLAGVPLETCGPKLSPETVRSVTDRLRRFLVTHYEQTDPAISAGTKTTYQGGRGDQQHKDAARTIYITAAPLQDYLRRRFPEHAATVVSDIKRLMGGYSKETYIVRLQTAAGEQALVIRKDGYGLPTGSSVTTEFEVLREMHALGAAVPKPFWLEADSASFGAAFMAVDFVSAKQAHMIVPRDRPRQLKWADSLARELARVHGATTQPDVDVRRVLREDIGAIQGRIENRERQPHPGLAFGMVWLIDHLDDLKGRPACRIHGDFGFHNLLIENDQICAILDWEFSHISDPMEDLAFARPFLDQIDAWQPFLETYCPLTGFSVDDKASRYFAVWKQIQNMVACLGSLNSLLLPQVRDNALAVAGTIYIPKFEMAILDALAASAEPALES